MGIYQRGQTVKLACSFTNAAGAPANPTTVTCKLEGPDGSEATYTSVSTPAITNPSTGTFELLFTPDQSGRWTHRWEGTTGTTVAVIEKQLDILGSAF